MNDNDLGVIRPAVTVADNLNLRRDGDALVIRRAALSRRARALESAIGLLLFERRPDGFRLTNAGRILSAVTPGCRCSIRLFTRPGAAGETETGC